MRLIDADALVDAMTGACNIFDAHGVDTTLARTLITIADKAPTIGGWISVKDRLPEEDMGACIVYDGFRVQHADHLIIDGEHIWSTPDCYESEEIRGVTHWMPLPKPPEDEEHNEV